MSKIWYFVIFSLTKKCIGYMNWTRNWTVIWSVTKSQKMQRYNLTCWKLIQDTSRLILEIPDSWWAGSQQISSQSGEVAGVVCFGRGSQGSLPVGADWQMGEIANPVWRAPTVWWMEGWPNSTGVQIGWQNQQCQTRTVFSLWTEFSYLCVIWSIYKITVLCNITVWTVSLQQHKAT